MISISVSGEFPAPPSALACLFRGPRIVLEYEPEKVLG